MHDENSPKSQSHNPKSSTALTKNLDLGSAFTRLVDTIGQLRHPVTGCPWDLAQTQKSLAQYAIEEAFELAEAIETNNSAQMLEELGDFLFQVILQAKVSADNGGFEIQQVLEQLTEKMIRRHPHVFTADAMVSLEQVWRQWEITKTQEKLSQKAAKEQSLFNHPVELPALQASAKIGAKTARYNFDWDNPAQVLKKVQEEQGELEAELNANTPNREAIEAELGDLLFSVAQLARHLEIDPEQALRSANRKFTGRFEKMLKISQVSIEKFKDLPAAEKESYWSQVKSDELR